MSSKEVSLFHRENLEIVQCRNSWCRTPWITDANWWKVDCIYVIFLAVRKGETVALEFNRRLTGADWGRKMLSYAPQSMLFLRLKQHYWHYWNPLFDQMRKCLLENFSSNSWALHMETVAPTGGVRAQGESWKKRSVKKCVRQTSKQYPVKKVVFW